MPNCKVVKVFVEDVELHKPKPRVELLENPTPVGVSVGWYRARQGYSRVTDTVRVREPEPMQRRLWDTRVWQAR